MVITTRSVKSCSILEVLGEPTMNTINSKIVLDGNWMKAVHLGMVYIGGCHVQFDHS